MQDTAITLVLLLLFLAGSIWLQIFLSNKRNKWLGLIIPLICFMFSIITVLSFAMFTEITGTTTTETIDGVLITDETITFQSNTNKPSIISMLTTATPVFLISNIPTLIFLAIYFACREKQKLRDELDKMNIQDLE